MQDKKRTTKLSILVFLNNDKHKANRLWEVIYTAYVQLQRNTTSIWWKFVGFKRSGNSHMAIRSRSGPLRFRIVTHYYAGWSCDFQMNRSSDYEGRTKIAMILHRNVSAAGQRHQPWTFYRREGFRGCSVYETIYPIGEHNWFFSDWQSCWRSDRSSTTALASIFRYPSKKSTIFNLFFQAQTVRNRKICRNHGGGWSGIHIHSIYKCWKNRPVEAWKVISY